MTPADRIAELEAEVERLTRERDDFAERASVRLAAQTYAEASLAAAREEAKGLRTALDGVWQAQAVDGEKCWCAYERLIHPQDDPQDALELEPNGHTKGCNAARAALGGTP